MGKNFIRITVTDQQSGYSEREYTIEVTEPLEFTTGSILPRATKNQPYFKSLEATGGTSPYTFVIVSGSLPAGINMSVNGLIGGSSSIPLVTGIYSFMVKITDPSERTASKDFTLYVDEPLSITTLNLITGITGQSYSQTLQATGGDGHYKWSVYSGILPQEITLDSTAGLFSGTPLTNSTIPLVLMVEDVVGRRSLKNLALIITVPLAFAITSLPVGAKNEPYSESALVIGGLKP